jgi:hypothetical protein
MENPFALFEERRRARDEERAALNKRLVSLNVEGERDAIAVQQLRVLYPNGWPAEAEADRREPPPADALEPAPSPPPSSVVQMQARGSEMTVKDMALTILRDAGPNGLTASQIKGKAMLRYKKQINSNTLTVSLVRLKPKVRCEGRVWFYVRQGVDRLINGVANGLPLDQGDYDAALFGGAAE